jgi:peptidoglycan L-alanyl-D-glutamate endopeptidase CwlK
MRDKISEPRVLLLHPMIRDEVKSLIEKAESQLPNVAIRVVQGLRTIEQQNELYAQGRTKPGNIVTNARGGSSFHNYGLAIDFALLYDKDGNGTYETLSWDTLKDFDKDGEKDWMEVVDIFEDAGYVWGGRFSTIKDNPHLEKHFGHTWRQLLAKYNEGKFIENIKYVRLT